MYEDAVDQFLKDGHAREVDKRDINLGTKINYLLHHPVFRKDSLTTKCRVVFDASSKNNNGVSLNDRLLTGPMFQPNLVSIIIRFRVHHVALMADIKMFLQRKLARQDQNVQSKGQELPSKRSVRKVGSGGLPPDRILGLHLLEH